MMGKGATPLLCTSAINANLQQLLNTLSTYTKDMGCLFNIKCKNYLPFSLFD